MLSPKKTKFRKAMKGRNRGLAWRGSNVSFGDYGLQVLEPGRVTALLRLDGHEDVGGGRHLGSRPSM